MLGLLARLAGRFMNRPVRLDPSIPAAYVAALAASMLAGLIRGGTA